MTQLTDKYTVPDAYRSDGCTVPDWVNVLTLYLIHRLMKPYRAACRWHDWARVHLAHYGVVTVEEADEHFRLRMIELGAWRLFARAVWLFVAATRWYYRHTKPVPADWLPHVFPGRTKFRR